MQGKVGSGAKPAAPSKTKRSSASSADDDADADGAAAAAPTARAYRETSRSVYECGTGWKRLERVVSSGVGSVTVFRGILGFTSPVVFLGEGRRRESRLSVFFCRSVAFVKTMEDK